MGLLDTELDPQELKRQQLAAMLMGLSGGLLGAQRGQEMQGLGRGLLGGYAGAQNVRGDLLRQQALQMQMRDKNLEYKMRQQAYDDMQTQHAAAAANLRPGMPEYGPPTASGEMQPAVPPSMNWQGYQNAIAGSSPQTAIQLDPFVRRQLMREAQGGLPQAAPPPEPYAASTGAAFGLPAGAAPPGGKGSAVQQFVARQTALAAAYRAKGLNEEADAIEAKLITLFPKSKAENIRGRGPDGKPTYYALDDTGGKVNTGIEPADPLHFGTNGQIGNIGFNPYTGAPESPGTKMQPTPGELLTDRRSAQQLGQAERHYQGQQELKRMEMDPMGIMGVNPKGMATGSATPVQAGIASGLHGEEFLKTLPEPVGNYVRNMIEGKQPYPGAFAMKSPQIQQYVLLASQADPNFDATTWAARQATRTDFTKGKAAQNIVALNTALSHMQRWRDSMDSLNNFGGLATPLNVPVNAVQEAFGDPRQKRVNTSAGAVAQELAKVFRQTGMSEADIKDWEKRLSRNMSPAAQEGVQDEAMHLLRGRIDALGQQYSQGMGKSQDGLQLLSPDAQKAFESLTMKQKQGGPATVSSDAEYENLKSGAEFIGPDGKKRRKP
jgi:hypothetical protein